MTVAASVPVLAAGGFPKTVQKKKFVRRVTWIRLSNRRPESDFFCKSGIIIAVPHFEDTAKNETKQQLHETEHRPISVSVVSRDEVRM